VEITFHSNKICRLCNDSKHALKKLGRPVAEKLRQRLDDLHAAKCLEDMRNAAGRIEELTADLKGCFSLYLNGLRLIFQPCKEPIPLKDDGGLDWLNITAVTVVAIKDYHG
jgi:proteic killer suppression protein